MSGRSARYWLPKHTRISPQVLAVALLLVSTVNLMFAVVPGAGNDAATEEDAGDYGGKSGDDGLGELGELAVVEDGSESESDRRAVSCSSLPIEEADECLRERERRVAEREARRKKGGGAGMTKSDKEAALEAYKKRVRREKALKFKQRDDERDQLAGYQAGGGCWPCLHHPNETTVCKHQQTTMYAHRAVRAAPEVTEKVPTRAA